MTRVKGVLREQRCDMMKVKFGKMHHLTAGTPADRKRRWNSTNLIKLYETIISYFFIWKFHLRKIQLWFSPTLQINLIYCKNDSFLLQKFVLVLFLVFNCTVLWYKLHPWNFDIDCYHQKSSRGAYY